jgi:hypothetical protein
VLKEKNGGGEEKDGRRSLCLTKQAQKQDKEIRR